MKFTKYNDLGAYHWHLYDTSAAYKQHADRVRDWVIERPVLDIGAGDGKITALLGAVGVDNEPEAVRLAQSKGVDVRIGDAYELPFATDSFPAVVMIDALEHMEFPEKALREAHRVCNNALYIVTPVRGEKLSDKFHYQEWSPQELMGLVESCGFWFDSSFVISEVNTQYAKFLKHG